MICSHCEKELSESARFCNSCGYPVLLPAPEPEYAPPRSAAQPQFSPRTRPLTTAQAVLIELISWLPLVNIIVLLVWASARGENINRARIASAKLVCIFIVLLASTIVLAALALLVYFGVITSSPFPVLIWP
jgi:heme/copper-type cytochrome/quinol oxidase subunit 1